MIRGWRLNLVLLGAVLGLSALVMLKPSRETPPATLSALKPAAASRIAVIRPGRPAIELRRDGERWLIEAPFKARADEFQVLRMLSVLEARPTAEMPAQDLQRFELDPPAAALDIDGVQYAFGAINTVTREQYLRRGDKVYVVELRHGAALPARAEALIRRVLLQENERPAAITLPQGEVRKVDGRWQRQPAADLGGDELQAYVDRWRQAAAASMQIHDGQSAAQDIRITLEDGRNIELGIVQRSPQLVLWRRDQGLHYIFLEAAGHALLDLPGVADKKAPGK